MAEQNQLALIQEGELQWTPKANAAITALNALVGGGTVKRLDDPLSWENGATGHSYAYVIQLLDGYKLVILTVAHVHLTNPTDSLNIASMPDNFTLADDNNFIRMSLSQHIMLANIGDNQLVLWVDGTSTETEMKDMYGTAAFLVKA